MSESERDQKSVRNNPAILEGELTQPEEEQQVVVAQQVPNERDPQADLELCEAATPGPWESVSGYSVREQHGYGPIIANMDCKEHSAEQMVHNACFICESREALPWYIRAYLAQREEIERLKTAAIAEAHARVRDEVIGNLHHLGVTPHCDWQGHSVGQVVGCEVSALQAEVERKYGEDKE